MQHRELNLTDAEVFELEVRQRIAGPERTASVFIVDMSGAGRLICRSGKVARATFLRSVANLLLRVCRDGDNACRIGEYTFGIVLRGVDSPVLQQLAAEKIIRLYKSAINEIHASFNTALGIGIAAYPAHAGNAAELIHNAEMALEAALSSGEPYVIYSADSMAAISLKWSLHDDLADAIDNRALHVEYQPKVLLATGRPVGAEALVRWNHQQHGAVPPSVFVPIACDIGRIEELTGFVLTMALRDSASWADAGERRNVAVNLEAQMFEHAGIEKLISSSASIWASEDTDLTIEITETSLASDSESNFERLNKLRAMGVGVSIDDFGTGYSSLSYFRNIPATELKIDKSFVSAMRDCSRNRNLVETIISLAHGFNLKVVGEGVESAQEFDMLAELGCDLIQGFYVAEPMPQDEFCRWLAEFESRHGSRFKAG